MKKRILLVASGRLDHSGVPSVIMTLVRRLSDEYVFDLLLNAESGEEGPLEDEFTSFGGEIISSAIESIVDISSSFSGLDSS